MVANGQANGAAEGGEGKSQARIELDAELGMKDGPVVDDFVDATRCQVRLDSTRASDAPASVRPRQTGSHRAQLALRHFHLAVQILYQNLKYTVEVKKAKGKGTETKELLRYGPKIGQPRLPAHLQPTPGWPGHWPACLSRVNCQLYAHSHAVALRPDMGLRLCLCRGMSGVINPGRLTAVMGASGAGKVSVLSKQHKYSLDCLNTLHLA